MTWHEALIAVLRTTAQILAAGVAITAFSLLLYAMTFNLRDRVARSFALIMVFVVISFTGEAIGSASTTAVEASFWLRVQWVGIILLPATYMHFSDALLTTTGKPSQWKRRLLIRLLYGGSLGMLALIPTRWLISDVQIHSTGVLLFEPTFLTNLFTLYFLVIMVLSWFNFSRAYQRTRTSTSRRRMVYLIVGAFAPAIGAFPFLPFASNVAVSHPTSFWLVAVLANLFVGTMMVVMAYAVAFFGVSWPDRVVKTRLFKWLMRGPLTASITLGVVTMVRRSGEVLGLGFTGAAVPIVMISSILLCEYVITLFAPLGERYLFYGDELNELSGLRRLEDSLLTKSDLKQFLEMVIAAVCDRMQARGAYIIALENSGLELVLTTGKTRFEQSKNADELLEIVKRSESLPEYFRWGDDWLAALVEDDGNGDSHLIGLLGIAGAPEEPDEEQLEALSVLAERAALGLRDRHIQQQLIQTLDHLTPDTDLIQRLRVTGRFDDRILLENDVPGVSEDMAQWVKEALTHYWGGPKLTESPLIQLKVVQNFSSEREGNSANALRAILREAIERIRPEGERKFTGEWILYNILEMKFLEGRKVRDIASKLAMSEADLYRKQRIAIEAVAKTIVEMENQSHE